MKEIGQFTVEDLVDPTLHPQMLADLAGARPDLWDAILAHPACYDALRQWIVAQRNQQASSMGAMSQQAGCQSNASQSLDQVAAGAKQMAAGVGEFFSQTVAPAAFSAANSVQQAISETADKPKNVRIPRYLLMGSALFALLALFMTFFPFARGFILVDSFYSSEAGQARGGIVMFVFLVATIILALVALVKESRKISIAYTVVAVLAGLLCMTISSHIRHQIAQLEPLVYQTASTLFLSFFAFVVIATAVVYAYFSLLLPGKAPQPQQMNGWSSTYAMPTQPPTAGESASQPVGQMPVYPQTSPVSSSSAEENGGDGSQGHLSVTPQACAQDSEEDNTSSKETDDGIPGEAKE